MDIETPTSLIGKTIIAKRFGAKQRSTIFVTSITDLGEGLVLVHGMVPSVKYPGDYRGYTHCQLDEIQEII